MKVSLIITTLNEEKTIELLLESILAQTIKPDEVIIVDGRSTDETMSRIKIYDLRFKTKKIDFKLVISKGATRGKGRNLGIQLSKNAIVALTDAGCVLEKFWLQRITEPFKNSDVDAVAGFYKMIARNNFEKAEKVFLGVLPNRFDQNFLPSARSLAFRKSIWHEAGGFDEKLFSAEDTLFAYKLVKINANLSRKKNARVEWRMPASLPEFFIKLMSYSKADAQSKIFWHPTQRLSSHNIKVILVIVRYVIFLVLFYYFLHKAISPTLFLAISFSYIFWSFLKVYRVLKDIKASLWGIILQVTADCAVMIGFIHGLF